MKFAQLLLAAALTFPFAVNAQDEGQSPDMNTPTITDPAMEPLSPPPPPPVESSGAITPPTNSPAVELGEKKPAKKKAKKSVKKDTKKKAKKVAKKGNSKKAKKNKKKKHHA